MYAGAESAVRGKMKKNEAIESLNFLSVVTLACVCASINVSVLSSTFEPRSCVCVCVCLCVCVCVYLCACVEPAVRP